MFSKLVSIRLTVPWLMSVASDNSHMVRQRPASCTVFIDVELDVRMTPLQHCRSSSSKFRRPSLHLRCHFKTIARLSGIFPLVFWSNFNISVGVLPKSSHNCSQTTVYFYYHHEYL